LHRFIIYILIKILTIGVITNQKNNISIRPFTMPKNQNINTNEIKMMVPPKNSITSAKGCLKVSLFFACNPNEKIK